MFRSRADNGEEGTSELYNYINILASEHRGRTATEKGKKFVAVLNEQFGLDLNPASNSPGWIACKAVNNKNARVEDVVTLAALLLG